MLQQILASCESIDTDLSVFLDAADNTYCVYVGVSLIERVSIDPDELSHKMLMGRLYNGGAKLCVLKKYFNHDDRTIKKWAAALTSGKFDDLLKAFVGVIIKKTTPELIAYVKQQYRNRSQLAPNYREIIIDRTEEVFGVRLSKTLVSNIFREVKDTPSTASKNHISDPEIVAVTTHLNEESSSNEPRTVQHSTCFPFMEADCNIETNTLFQHAGLVVFGFALQGYDSFQCQLILQLLLGAINIEQSKSLCHGSMSFFSKRMITTSTKLAKSLLKHNRAEKNQKDITRACPTVANIHYDKYLEIFKRG
jgi:hypothetical protein